MTDDQIRYDVLTQEALRSVIRSILEGVAKTGLPGEHHFYIAFDTQADGVSISKRLKEQYPDEMTIVLQYQFWDMEVTEERFEVKLSFNNVPERLVVPFASVKAFFDPSVQFGLQFGAPGAANDASRAGSELPNIVKQVEDGSGAPVVGDTGEQDTQARDEDEGPEALPRPEGQVVELDAFRKK